MATPQNTNNTKVTQTAKQNYSAVSYSNDHGSLRFGHIHKQGDVTCDLMIEGSDGRHQFSLDKDGPRKGWTTGTSPGAFQIQCGYDLKSGTNSLFLNAVNGDIIIKADNGRVRIEGLDIDIIAKGPDNTQGTINVKSNESITLTTKNFTLDASSSYKLLTTGQAEIVANTSMRIYSSLIQGITDACAKKDSKVGGKAFQNKHTKVS